MPEYTYPCHQTWSKPVFTNKWHTATHYFLNTHPWYINLFYFIAASNNKMMFGTCPSPALDAWNSQFRYSFFVVEEHWMDGATCRLWKKIMANSFKIPLAGFEHCAPISSFRSLWNLTPNIHCSGTQQVQQTEPFGSWKYPSVHVLDACLPIHLKQWLKILGHPPVCTFGIPSTAEHNLHKDADNLPIVTSFLLNVCSLDLSISKLSSLILTVDDVCDIWPSTMLVSSKYFSWQDVVLLMMAEEEVLFYI